ncbi:hypothetical protein P3X46_028300 [Hevea brasiliensis]|uniref:Terpene synthase N-terminal domain-containing protein n=1 Tax=Hevea brasiliensis TaxID=3981 RepID=A0ABQ9KPS5_HEVBR|nr:probable terpene synthase 8 [Hevea brasiliensis]KAJ9145977.1 hypothetical protein P3X46_028300 [Hevea brasiliensis]
MTTQAKSEQDNFRPSANFPSSVWGCSFASLSFQDSEFESLSKEVEIFKEKVKDILMQSTRGLIENIEFIDILCCLGVSYYFENEIEEQLNHTFIALPTFLHENDYDLHVAALLFRILRQHGHKVTCDVFNKFKDNDGRFKKTITNDVKSLLGLYEASFLSVHGEDILDEALAFTKPYLETLAEQASPHLAEHIKNSLVWPIHQSMERLKIHQYISFYEKEESRNETLLKFAELDYNRIQLLYRQELAILSRWSRDLNVMHKYPYTRDRIVEAYVWALGCICEPQFGASRLMIAKYVQMETVLDDTYDAYGTLDELYRFTAAFERCNVDGIDDHLSGYMEYLYKDFLKLFEETENDGNEGSSLKTSYAKEMFKELTRGYIIEAQWAKNGYVPAFDDYVQNGLIVSTCDVLASAFLLGMKDVGIKEMVWIRSNPKIVNSAKLLGTLKNDIAGHEEEQKRGDSPSSVECYMKEFGVSKEKAVKEIDKIFVNAWKDINEELLLQPRRVSKIILKYFLNFGRMSEFLYNFLDFYTNPSSMKDYVTKLLVDPFSI